MVEQEAQTQNPREQWWVTTDRLDHGGRKIIGPFKSQDLAIRVRSYVEKVENRSDLWVDDERV